jgi:hypothetical protein
VLHIVSRANFSVALLFCLIRLCFLHMHTRIRPGLV